MLKYDESRGTAPTSWETIYRYKVFVCSIKLRRLQINIYIINHNYIVLCVVKIDGATIQEIFKILPILDLYLNFRIYCIFDKINYL